jgi:hypothetical protein
MKNSQEIHNIVAKLAEFYLHPAQQAGIVRVFMDRDHTEIDVYRQAFKGGTL